jgi:hypothetical protein
MLNRRRVLDSFQTALAELSPAIACRKATLSKVADRARDVYSLGLPPGAKRPSVWTFRGYLLGKRADPEILSLIAASGVQKLPRINRSRLMEAFRRAIGEADGSGKKQYPRTIAVKAHQYYCLELPSEGKRPALVSFTQRMSGRSADAQILALLKEGGIENRGRVTLNRERLVASFRECLRKFRCRIEKGIARPIQVADCAHRLYVENQAGSEPAPSRLTFRSLVYGQGDHPEVQDLLRQCFKDRDLQKGD